MNNGTDPMQNLIESEKIAAIHTSLNRGVFILSGGGSEFLSRLLSVPGASATVLEACVPYSTEAMTEFLHQKPEQFCCEPTARRLAAMAWLRAMKYAKSESLSTLPANAFLGFGLTATLATSRKHRGKHRVFAAFHSLERTVSYSLEFEKDKLNRGEEEKLTADWALNLLTAFCGIETEFHDSPLKEQTAPDLWQKVLNGELPFIELHRDGGVSRTLSPEIRGIFPGSFAPIHEGHCQMHDFARQKLGGEIALELSVLNADKPPLDYVSIQERLTRIFSDPNFTGNTVLLSRLPFFELKSRYFPNQTFLVGMDTLKRIASPKYHFGEKFLLEKSLANLKKCGTRFLVFGRTQNFQEENSFETFRPSAFLPSLSELCEGIGADEFRNDHSSTQIRSEERKNASDFKLPTD